MSALADMPCDVKVTESKNSIILKILTVAQYGFQRNEQGFLIIKNVIS